MRRIVAALALTAAVVLMLPALPSAEASDGVPAFGNVFVIVGENTSLSELNAKDAPYQVDTIEPNSAWFTNYWALSHYSTSNYVGMTSGQFLRCHQLDEKPATCNQDAPNIFAQLSDLGISWKAWNESMPAPCYLVNAGTDKDGNAYRVKHNPAAYYENIVGPDFSGTTGDAFCGRHVVSMGTTDPNNTSTFDASLDAGRVPRFNYIVPNMCEDGHDNCKPTGNPIKQFDDFLAREIPKIQASDAWTSNSVIFVVYDEAQGGGPGKAVKFAGGNVPFAVISPLVNDDTYGDFHNHYGLLRTLEEGFGITTFVGSAGAVPAIDEIWS